MTSDTSSEFWTWWELAWPSMLTNLCRMGMEFTDVSVLGHYRDGIYLSSSSYASIMIGSVMVIVVRGMGGNAVGALCSAAYGAGNRKLMGLWLQVALICCSVTAVLIGPVWIWGGDLLRTLVGKDQISESGANNIDLFLRISLLWILPSAWTSCLNSFLVAQKVVFPQMLAAIAGILLNLAANFLFIYGLHFGYPGSPLATAFSRWFVLLAVVYTVRSRGIAAGNGTWERWDLREATKQQRVKEYLRQALPTAISGMVEEYQFQTISILGGKLGPDVVATHNGFLVLILLLCSVMWGITAATQTRIGHHLGHGDLVAVFRVIRLATIVAATWGLFVTMVITVFHQYVGDVFSAQHEVQVLAREISFIVGIGYFLLAIFYISMSVLIATFQQLWIVAAFVTGAWCVAVPLAWVLAFDSDSAWLSWYPARLPWDVGPGGRGVGLLGLWIGIAVGYFVTTILATAAVFRTKWPAAVDAARRKSEVAQQEDDGELLSFRGRAANGLSAATSSQESTEQ